MQILSYAIAQGYPIPSRAVRAAQNDLLQALKADGIWDKLDVFYVFANDAGPQFSTLNWKNPALHQATLVNAVTWASNQGFKGDGVSAYLDTNFNPSTGGSA